MAENRIDFLPHRLMGLRGASLATRILAVNIIALALLAGSIFYLDSYRKQLIAERFVRAGAESQIIADALAASRRSELPRLVKAIGTGQKMRLRIYDRRGRLRVDSFRLAEPSYTLADPEVQAWYLAAARWLDQGMDALLRAPDIEDHVEPVLEKADSWPEIAEARKGGSTVIRMRHSPDRTPMISAALPIGRRGEILLTTRSASDVTQAVRDARRTLAFAVGAALIVSILLSLFLARTIIVPLRELVRAAVRVRLGRDREVVVPRLPERRDEIGLLARAISDMTAALRQRIDAVDAFAADVAHEIKNPLASLRGALDSMGKVEDKDLRGQLVAIAAHDVWRIDRLVTEIARMSRIDAQLSRTAFEPVDMVRLVENVIATHVQDDSTSHCRIALRHDGGGYVVPGSAASLESLVANLVDNAISFSPPDGEVTVAFERGRGRIRIRVNDEGPGVAPESREKVFERFHTLRPEKDDFGRHSGLGLSIARTIAEGHFGSLTAGDRPDGMSGACFLIDLPDWDAAG